MKEVSLSIKSVETNEAVEHWHFKIETKRSNIGAKRSQRNVAKVGIVRVIRQIVMFIATLPDLNDYTYSSLSYEDDGKMQMPAGWHHGVLDVIPNSRGNGHNAFATDFQEVQTVAEYTETEADPSHMQLIDPDSGSDASNHGSSTNGSLE